jgi:hypothetical protein
MKIKLFLAITLAAAGTFAATTKATETAATVTNQTTTISTINKNSTTEDANLNNHIYFSTNFIDLSKGSGNVGADFMVSNKLAAAFRVRTTSTKEDVTKNGVTDKVTVDRAAYSLGVSIFPVGIKNGLNYVISPAIAFGTKKDLLDVDTQSGLSLKLTALLKVHTNLAAEVGLRGDNLEDGTFIGDAYAGLGYMF